VPYIYVFAYDTYEESAEVWTTCEEERSRERRLKDYAEALCEVVAAAPDYRDNIGMLFDDKPAFLAALEKRGYAVTVSDDTITLFGWMTPLRRGKDWGHRLNEDDCAVARIMREKLPHLIKDDEE
jgi:hypothetical protein